MKQVWTQEELIEHWTLGASELVLLMNKSGIGRLGFALLLKFFQMEGRFPANKNEVPQAVIEYVARQTEVAHRAVNVGERVYEEITIFFREHPEPSHSRAAATRLEAIS